MRIVSSSISNDSHKIEGDKRENTEGNNNFMHQANGKWLIFIKRIQFGFNHFHLDKNFSKIDHRIPKFSFLTSGI